MTRAADNTPASRSRLGELPTEQRNPATTEIDTLSTIDLVTTLNEEDFGVAKAVEWVLPEIARGIDLITRQLRAGGRLIYIGAGTSGRLGVLDASECPPTFNTPPGLVVGIIAGGDHALRHSVEEVEDRPEEGAKALREIDLTGNDVVVGIAASGRTPYVIGALRYARETGAHTISLSNVKDSAIAKLAAIEIAPVTGPEPVTGSTRMKAGTAQKMVLNMLSTGTMIRLGKTYGNLMVDMQLANAKLRQRAEHIVAEATGLPQARAADLLASASNDVKTAIVMHLLEIPADQAASRLAQGGGVIHRAVR